MACLISETIDGGVVFATFKTSVWESAILFLTGTLYVVQWRYAYLLQHKP